MSDMQKCMEELCTLVCTKKIYLTPYCLLSSRCASSLLFAAASAAADGLSSVAAWGCNFVLMRNTTLAALDITFVVALTIVFHLAGLLFMLVEIFVASVVWATAESY